MKWFIQEIGNKGLAQLAASLPSQSARGIVCYGLFDGKKVHLFDGEMYGRIADKVRDGGMGIGYDAIFINEGFNKTRAEMSEEEYARTSYRMEAIEKMRALLTER